MTATDLPGGGGAGGDRVVSVLRLIAGSKKGVAGVCGPVSAGVTI